MRPVARQPSTRTFGNYQEARIPLIDTIGDYCSYCESSHQAAVEHKLPRKQHPNRTLRWDNFLLACASCNTHKRNRQAPGDPAMPEEALDKYLWPDRDNTAQAFSYEPSNRVKVSQNLTPQLRALADATMRMVGLDVNDPSDLRWRRRNDAWTEAILSRSRLLACPTAEMREQIAASAGGRGFWSVWRTVFADDTDMLRLLNDAFAGTAPDCFDSSYQLVARSGGRL